MNSSKRLINLTWHPILRMLNKKKMIIKLLKTTSRKVIRRWNTSLIRTRLSSCRAALPLIRSKRPLNSKSPTKKMINPCNKRKKKISSSLKIRLRLRQRKRHSTQSKRLQR